MWWSLTQDFRFFLSLVQHWFKYQRVNKKYRSRVREIIIIIVVFTIISTCLRNLCHLFPHSQSTQPTWATRALPRVQQLRSCWRRHVARATTSMLQGTPGPPVHVVAKSVHDIAVESLEKFTRKGVNYA